MEYIYENFAASGLQTVAVVEGVSLNEGVLAKVKGPSFFLDGFSRNGRFYPKKLWENALKHNETKIKLDRGLMFGCIGHPKDYTLDNLLESGKVSHKVTDIYIDKKTGEGIAEYEILDTPSGRILNTILKSGSDMYVSTRAFGGFTNETKDKDGRKYKILDDKNFVIESIDFVIEPGFLDTNPQLVESIKEDLMELAKDKHHIVCESGVCSLGEDMMKIEEQQLKEEQDIEKKMDEVVEEMEEIVEAEVDTMDYSVLENLSKEEVIVMLKNVVYENKMLASVKSEDITNTEKTDSNANAEVSIDSKMLMNYLSYLELFIKMVRYNNEFEKYYSDLVEIIDRDDKLTLKDMEVVDGIIDEVLKEKELDESIEEIAENLKKMFDKITNKVDDEDDKDDKEHEEHEREEEAAKSNTEVESFVDYMIRQKTKVVEKVTLKEDATKVNNMKSQVLKLKEATIMLTSQLEESMTKEPTTIEKVVTEIEYKVPKEVTEKIGEQSGLILELKGTISEMKTQKANEASESFKENQAQRAEKREFENKISVLETEVSSVEKNLHEVIEENEAIYNRNINEYKITEAGHEKEIKLMKENQIAFTKNFNSLVEKKDKIILINTELKNEVHETKALYNASIYKLEVPVVKKLMEIYSGKKLKEALTKEQRIHIRDGRQNESKIEVPTYNPNKASVKRSNMLETLVK